VPDGDVAVNSPAAEDEVRFDLFNSDGHFRLVWRLTDPGVVVEPDALRLRRAGRWTRLPYDRIVSVTLSTGAVGTGIIGNCTIELVDGTRTIITNMNERGVADGRRDGDYRRFVVTFHQALVECDSLPSIRFRSGFSEARSNGLFVVMLLASALFVVLPLVLLLATGELKMLWALLVGGTVLVFPAWKVFGANRPATYNPGAPPDLLP
jgi:hypothetical protein